MSGWSNVSAQWLAVAVVIVAAMGLLLRKMTGGKRGCGCGCGRSSASGRSRHGRR